MLVQNKVFPLAQECAKNNTDTKSPRYPVWIRKSMNVYGLILPLFKNVLGVPCVYRAESFKTAGEGPEVTAANSTGPLVCCINLFMCCLWSEPKIHW